jgi:hypothetical protein
MKVGKGRLLCLAQIHLDYNDVSWWCKNCHEIVIPDKPIKYELLSRAEYHHLQEHFTDIEKGDYLPTFILMSMILERRRGI